MNIRVLLLSFLFLFAVKTADATTPATDCDEVIELEVRDALSKAPLEMATVIANGQGQLTNSEGRIRIELQACEVQLEVSFVGYQLLDTLLVISANTPLLTVDLQPILLNEATVRGDKAPISLAPTTSLRNFTVFSAKKADIIRPERLNINASTNNARQLFSRVAGLTIWENGDGGSQLNIGTRGLNPSRTSNFNTRQNGYDISADPLGYPETYYTPPLQAISRIELIRGAASLQFGPQFGGMLNFELLTSPQRSFGFITEQSAGSFGMLTSFNAVGGTSGRTSYFAYWQHRRGDGWRDRSAFESNNAHVRIRQELNEFSSVTFEYSRYRHLAETPGGLTDRQFELDPETVLRERNWFGVNWDLLSLKWEYRFSGRTRLMVQPFALVARRDALGHLGRISRVDPGGARELIRGEFSNWGVEARMVHNWQFRSLPASLVGGVRYFDGNTRNRQNAAVDGAAADFSFADAGLNTGSDYRFDNSNVSLFVEQVLRVTPKFTVTPGLRYEHIRTASAGSYTQIVTDAAGNVLPTYPRSFAEADARSRNILLGGVGVAYKFAPRAEFYANYSTNYRAINFSDIRISNPNQVVDAAMRDESGSTFDAGVRGSFGNWLFLDASVFRLNYNDKIGTRLDTATLNPVLGTQLVQRRTNLSDAVTQGIEFSAEMNLLRLFSDSSDWRFTVFGNVSWLEGVYRSENDPAIDGNRIEYVPEWNVKAGIQAGWRGFGLSWQVTHMAEQFSDATNAPAGADPNAVVGAIPAYTIQDISVSYRHKGFSLQAGVDNFLDERYFTRRASGYPGPGILPAAPRNFYLTLRVQRW